MRIERLADGLGAAEGPAFLPDGRFIFVEIWRSRVSVWTSENGVQEHAHVGGVGASSTEAKKASGHAMTFERTATGGQQEKGRISAGRPAI